MHIYFTRFFLFSPFLLTSFFCFSFIKKIYISLFFLPNFSHSIRRHVFIVMSDNIFFSLHTLPVDLVYRILDHLDTETIFCALRNVCQRLNSITDTYRPYQVRFYFIFSNIQTESLGIR